MLKGGGQGLISLCPRGDDIRTSCRSTVYASKMILFPFTRRTFRHGGSAVKFLDRFGGGEEEETHTSCNLSVDSRFLAG